MKVLLIAPYPDITALGVRFLSSSLEAAGHRCTILFIPAPVNAFRYHSEFRYAYTMRELDAITELAAEDDLIGVSFMTNYYERAVQITTRIRRAMSVPVVWGGVHPTACPEQALEHVDYVCRGESEAALVEFCTKLDQCDDTTTVRNFWLRDATGRIVKNEVQPLEQDLDSLPFPDYRLDRHYVLDRDRQVIDVLDKSGIARYLVADAISRSRDPSAQRGVSALYQTMATRGCPHHCSFCYNNEYRKLYNTKHYLRRRSVDNLMTELAQLRNPGSPFGYVVLCDDSFFAASDREIETFAARYRDEVGVPFHCLGSPQTVSERKLACLVEAGLVSISMGIQSGSARTNHQYDRHFNPRQVIAAASIINSFRDRIRPPAYDFIIDNPFESLEDERASLELILELPRPFHLCLGSLVFFPGTPLYRQARDEGILSDDLRQVYRKEYHAKRGTYINLLFYLSGTGVQRFLMRTLMSPVMFMIFNRRIWGPAYQLLFRSIRLLVLLRGWSKRRKIEKKDTGDHG